MPITKLAARLPFAAIGTPVLQISISARDTQFPLKMPDIRLQANFCGPTIGQSLLAGGVHIRGVRQQPSALNAFLSHLVRDRIKREPGRQEYKSTNPPKEKCK